MAGPQHSTSRPRRALGLNAAAVVCRSGRSAGAVVSRSGLTAGAVVPPDSDLSGAAVDAPVPVPECLTPIELLIVVRVGWLPLVFQEELRALCGADVSE